MDSTVLTEFNKCRETSQKFDLRETGYLEQRRLGAGAYGIVCQAVDELTGCQVAIKKVSDVFDNALLAKRTLREVCVLRELSVHSSLLSLISVIKRDADLYLVLELMDTDLHHIIHGSKQSLSSRHYQSIMSQLLRGICYLHSAGVVHRDLKPITGDSDSEIMTQYVATRWYRAPELLFSMLYYTAPVDIWSLACIFGELLQRRQLFPGRDQLSQLKLIIMYLGTPTNDVVNKIHSDIVRSVICQLGFKTPLPMHILLPKGTPDALDLISKMLRLAPWERITASEAIEHPYLGEYGGLKESDKYLGPPLNLCDPPDPIITLKTVVDKDMTTPTEINVCDNTQTNNNNNCCHTTAKLPNGQYASEGTNENDIYMLSAKLDDTLTIKNGDNNALNVTADSVEDSSSVQTRNETNGASLNEAKSKLRDVILSKQKRNNVKDAAVTGSDCSEQHFLKAKVERKQNRKKRTLSTTDVTESSGISEQDQCLLDRWKRMQPSVKQTAQRLQSLDNSLPLLDDGDSFLSGVSDHLGSTSQESDQISYYSDELISNESAAAQLIAASSVADCIEECSMLSFSAGNNELLQYSTAAELPIYGSDCSFAAAQAELHIATACGPPAGQLAEISEIITRALLPSPQLSTTAMSTDSAQLMADWLAATDLTTEDLSNLEREVEASIIR